MKRLCVFAIILFSVGSLEAQDFSGRPVQIQDVVPLLDRNMQQLRSGDIRYTVRYLPSERAQKLLRDTLHDPSASPVTLSLLRALTVEKISNVRLRFEGNKIRYEFNEESDGSIPQKQSNIWGFDGKIAWMYNKQERSGSLLQDKRAILYDDIRCPHLMHDPFTSWSYELGRRSQNPAAARATAKRVPDGLLIDIPDAANEAYIKRILADPARGYLVKRMMSLVRDRVTEKEEAAEVVEVQPSVWFPTKQITVVYDHTGAELLRKITEVTDLHVNVNIPQDVFEPDFPPGTRVSDMVRNRVYVVTTPLWTFRRTLVALLIIGILVAFWWWRYRLAGKRTTV